MKKRILSMLLVAVLMATCVLGCGKSSTKEGKGKDSNGKVKLTCMIYAKTDPFCDTVKKMVIDHFPQYDITIKTWDEPTVEQTVKTAFAADQAIDVVSYWPTYMKKFEGTGIPLNLGPYLEKDKEWKEGFAEGTLDVGKTSEGILAVPNGTSYPVLQYNREIFKEAGVEEVDRMSWDEFVNACEKIKKTGKAPISVQTGWACWFVRNALMQCWDNNDELDKFIAGEIPFKDKKVVEAMDKVADLFNSDYVYPAGKEAVTTSEDDALAAFVNGDAAMYCNIVNGCTQTSEKVGSKFETGVTSWPSMAKDESMYHLLGSSNGYMVMSNTKHPKEAVEVVTYLTSQEVLQAVADSGVIVTNVNVTSSDENYKLYSRDASKVYPDEVINLSSEIFDNIVYNQPSNYLFQGDAALDELEGLREATK